MRILRSLRFGKYFFKNQIDTEQIVISFKTKTILRVKNKFPSPPRSKAKLNGLKIK